ncbi:hypothetical protein STEG23_029726, partial [Scotinomys teguina]
QRFQVIDPSHTANCLPNLPGMCAGLQDPGHQALPPARLKPVWSCLQLSREHRCTHVCS